MIETYPWCPAQHLDVRSGEGIGCELAAGHGADHLGHVGGMYHPGREVRWTDVASGVDRRILERDDEPEGPGMVERPRAALTWGTPA